MSIPHESGIGRRSYHFHASASGLSSNLVIHSDRPLVLDISRLIWRLWARRLPTGIDKVCLAYLEHFGPRSLAMIQRGRLRFVFDPMLSDRLFNLLLGASINFRAKLAALLAYGLLHRHGENLAGKIYLNVGHTGLDAEGFVAWLADKGLRPVFMVHDLIPITHPQYCRKGEDERHARRIGRALECADMIIVNSHGTQGALEHYARQNNIGPAKIAVAWLGVDKLTPSLARKQLERPYFVVIGTIEARKNHIMLLRIWQRLATEMGAQTPFLILIGQRGWEANEAFALLDRANADGHVVELGHCGDAELAEWVAGARALLMPSHVEGYGLPAIEALINGLPVIALDLAVYREVAGGIPLYLAADDEGAWQAAIIDFTRGCEERNRQLAALPGFEAPTWAQHFAIVERLLAEITWDTRSDGAK